MQTCRHCQYYPAFPGKNGYCSWDCHDHDYRPPEDGREMGSAGAAGVNSAQQPSNSNQTKVA